MSSIRILQSTAEAFGGPSALAYELGRSPQDLGNLLHGHSPIPVAFAFELEVLTRGAVRAADLRPDLAVWLDALRDLPSPRQPERMPTMTDTPPTPAVDRAMRVIRQRQLARLIERGQPAILPDSNSAQSFRALARRHGIATSSRARADGRFLVRPERRL